MGTKEKPGAYDCLTKAEPDEPIFVLLGRDPTAAFVVLEWALLREHLGQTSKEQIDEARECAGKMAEYARTKGKSDAVRRAGEAWAALHEALKAL